MTPKLNHIRRLRLPLSCLMLSALLAWSITPDFHLADRSAAYYKNADDQVELLLDFDRNVQVQAPAKEHASSTPPFNSWFEAATETIDTATVAGTPALKVLYSTVEINAP